MSDETNTPAGQDDEVRAVIYADAGVRPVNPGFGGWGFHGYTYKTQEPKRSGGPAQYALTVSGYQPRSQKPKEVTPIRFIDALGTIPHASNNGAEVLAAANAIALMKEWGVKDVLIKTDSRYVIIGAQEHLPRWRNNGWRKADGSQISNLEHWQYLNNHLSAVLSSGSDIRFEWVKGHNGDFGNERADKYATVGALASGSGENKVLRQFTDAQDYWKEEQEPHPLLAQRSIYYILGQQKPTDVEYYLGNHGKDDELLGKRMSDGSYAYVKLKTPDPYVALLIEKHHEVCPERGHVVAARLDELHRADTRKDLMLFGKEMFVTRATRSVRRRHDLFIISSASKDDEGNKNNNPIANVLNPAFISQRAVQSLNFLKGMHEAYEAGRFEQDGVWITDITSSFFIDEVKPVKKTKGADQAPPEIVGKKLLASFSPTTSGIWVKANRQPGESLLEIDLCVGIDVPTRNTFKKLEKLQPKVSLVVWHENQNDYRYATIIEVQDASAIWCGYYTNFAMPNEIKFKRPEKDKLK